MLYIQDLQIGMVLHLLFHYEGVLFLFLAQMLWLEPQYDVEYKW